MVTPAPELLAPAGSPEALDAAVAEGADAVYLGLKSFNARMRSANFAWSQFEGALRSLHRMGRKVYVTVNTVFEQREADRLYQLLKYLAALEPDGIIVQDFGVLLMAREFPRLKLHASTQMNIASARGANALSKYGVSRVVLARELSLEEIEAVRQSTNVELEVFVHGALCVSASGLCLFSSYLGGKSANRGLCTQACRRIYRVEEGEPGYYFSPCDLSLIDRVESLAGAGVRSFKIEGRMKSAEYVGTVVSAYRRVIDSLGGGDDQRRRALEEARDILRNDFARPKTEFFFGGLPGGEPGWLRPGEDGGTGIRLGTIVKVSGSGPGLRALIKSGGAGIADNGHGANGGDVNSALAGIAPGDSLRFHRADDSRRLSHKLTFAEYSRGGWLVSVPEGFGPGDSAYLIQTRTMTRRYPPALPKDLGAFRRQPGRERAPRPPLPDGPHSPRQAAKPGRAARQNAGAAVPRTGAPRKSPVGLPEGLYAAVASIEDLYVVQSLRPAGVILPVNRKTLRVLLESNTLPFKSGEIIAAFDPYFPQGDEQFLAAAAADLETWGCGGFILNNPGHFSLFSKNVNRTGNAAPPLIAGPWLYTFNGWSAAFVLSLGAAAFVTPLENNRQNLEKTVPPPLRSSVMITLFAWPPLFRIRTAAPGGLYDFTRLHGSRDESFSLVNGEASSVVVPGEPFSITDKRPFLEASGFRRFILDFSGGIFDGAHPLKKKEYKEVMKAAGHAGPGRTAEAAPLSGISRFNWKDGFYSEERSGGKTL